MAERWVNALGDLSESPRVDAFLIEIDAVCRRHGMSVNHRGSGGSFEIEVYSPSSAARLLQASDALPPDCIYGPPPIPLPKRATIDGQRAILYWDTHAYAVAQGVDCDVAAQGETEQEAVARFSRCLATEVRVGLGQAPAPPMRAMLGALWAGLPEWSGER